MPTRATALLVLAALAAVPAAVARADAPKVSSLFPGGASRGQSVEIEAKGAFDPWPASVRVDRPGLEVVSGGEAGRFTATVAPDAAPGVYWLRVYNADGAAPLRPFVVGTAPEVNEAEPNEAQPQAQAVPVDGLGVVVNGRLQKPGDVDSFAVALGQGQTLVASLEANRRLGSPMDGVLQVASPAGFVVDHADDAPLLDPTLAFTAEEAGTYVVRVFAFPAQPDSSIRFAGGDDYVYRLSLTTAGLVEFAHPSAVAIEESTPVVAAVGRDLPEAVAPLETSSTEGGPAVAWSVDLLGFAELERSALPVVVVADAGTDPVDAPALLCGRLESPGQHDTITIRAPAGRSIALRVEGRSLGSPIDPVLRVVDSSGKELASEDDSRRSADPRAAVAVPEDGLLRVSIRDLFDRGGATFIYRVEAREVAPSVSATVAADHFELSPGKPLEIAVEIDRRDGFDRPLSIAAEGLPGGVSCEPVTSEASGDSSKQVTLRLVGDDAGPWSGPIRLNARVPGEETAHPVKAGRVDQSETEDLWLTVLGRAEAAQGQ